MESKDSNYDLNKWFKTKDKLFNFETPLVMGIINVTPDSFYSDSRTLDFEQIQQRIEKLIRAEIDILDIGGVSTRPNADLLNEEVELERVLPVVRFVRENYPNILISIDTFRAEVARAAVKEGAHLVNDVYGGRYDDKMFDVIAELDVPYILMHSRGDASNMQDKCDYDDVVKGVLFELSERLEMLREKGVKDVIIDPGFGFSKDLDQNYDLLRGVDYLSLLNCPILIGVSRKSMIYRLFDTNPKEALNGTTILNTFSLLKKNAIIRVHDVKEAVEVKRIVKRLKF